LHWVSGEIGMNVTLWLPRQVADGRSWHEPARTSTLTELMFADPEFIEERAEDLLGIVLTSRARSHRRGAVFVADPASLCDAAGLGATLEEAGLVGEVELNDRSKARQHPARSVRDHLYPAVALDRRGQRAADRDAVRPVSHRDWKLDEEPLIGVPATEEELLQMGDDGVLALVCDLTNVFNSASSALEGEVYRGQAEEVHATPASACGHHIRLQRRAPANVGRVAQTGRELLPAGRSTGSSRYAGHGYRRLPADGRLRRCDGPPRARPRSRHRRAG
jgi:ribonuclease J